MSEQKLLVQDAITAATTQTLAGARASVSGANLSAKADLHIIATCANRGDSVALPVSDTKLSGSVKTIRNEGAKPCWVWPDTNGVIFASCGSLGANVPFSLKPNCYVKLHSSDGWYWRVIEETADKTELLTAAEAKANITILASEYNTTYVVPPPTDDCTFTLPAPTSNFKCKFILNATAGHIISLTSTAANMRGIVLMRAENAVDAAITSLDMWTAAMTTLRFTAAATVGSYVILESDGVNYFATAVSNVALSFTTA